MIEPAKDVLEILQGDSFYYPWGVEEPDGTVIDFLSSAGGSYTSGWFAVANDYASLGGEVLLSGDTDDGRLVIEHFTDDDGEVWSGYIIVPAHVTAALTPWGEAVWQLQLSNATTDMTILYGPAILHPATKLN